MLIDRSGRHFGTVLNYLRDGSVPLPESTRELGELLGEARYYLVQGLIEDCQLALYSTEPRALLFHTALLVPKTTRSTQGVAVMTMKPKYQLSAVKTLEESGIVNQSRYRVRALPATGALLKPEDSEEKQIDLLGE